MAPVANPRRILFVANGRQGRTTAHVRGALYRPYFEGDGWDVAFVDTARDSADAVLRAARGRDVALLLKVTDLDLVRRLREIGMRLVFDLTDSLWTPGYRVVGWHDLERILRAVDAVFCENDIVAGYAARYNADTRVLPTSSQVESFDVERGIAPGRGDGRVRVGWVGGPTTLGALEKVRDPLRSLSARHPELEVRVVGCRAEDAARILGKIPHSVLPEYDEAGMIQEMLALDVGLFPAPLDLDDYRVRGPLKALLYMAAGVPVVCQNAGDCARLITDGIDGMLADSQEEWERKLEELIVSPELRKRMGLAGLARARNGHSLEQVYQATRDALVAVADKASPARPSRVSTGTRVREWAASRLWRAYALGARLKRRIA